MSKLSFIEMIALAFTGLAGIASAVQAYVSYETRGEVSRAIVFSERIDACSDVLVAIEPFVRKAAETRPAIEGKPASGEGRYSLPGLFYGQSAGSSAFKSRHEPRLQDWERAYSTFKIVLPEAFQPAGSYFNGLITRQIEDANFLDRGEMITTLREIEQQAQALTGQCRQLF
ncbi:MAG: hypothetical protein MRY63_08610 [Neomegalonema sp.]|nr:hypothetical protein [Neomegalonema sp.]